MARNSQPGPIKCGELKALLCDFETRFGTAKPALGLDEQHERLLAGFEKAHADWKKEQVFLAEDFNVLQTMRLTRKELCHSDILAWLLDHRLEVFGSHAQGNLGFRLFLQRLGLPLKYAKADYQVVREALGRQARLDILIQAAGQFVIGIENKIDSQEGEDQTHREWADLRKWAEKLSVPRTNKVEAFFLTPDERKPQSSNFREISWRLVADVFEAFAEEAKPPMVKMFAQHYAEALRRHVVFGTPTEQEEYDIAK